MNAYITTTTNRVLPVGTYVTESSGRILAPNEYVSSVRSDLTEGRYVSHS
ncbi:MULTISPECIES: hypothetical protein [Cryobacterium]|nr:MULTISPECIES: hypothetical protein [Cryobacterium]